MAGNGPNQVTNPYANVSSSTVITVGWTNNSADGPTGTDYRTYIWYNEDGGSWTYLAYRTGSQNAYDHTVSSGKRYGYKLSAVWRCNACAGVWYWADGTAAGSGANPTFTLSSYTTPVYRAIYADSKTGGIAVGGSYADTLFPSGYYTTGGIAVGGSSTNILTIANSFTGGIAVGGIYTDAVVTPVNYAYYIGTDDGVVYRFGHDYQGDRGTSISSTWESKTVDFSDMDPVFTGIEKTVYGVTLFYEDKASSADFTISVSTDGGATWTAASESCGTNTGKVAEKSFFFIQTGHYFKFKITHGSASNDFKWLGLRVEFEPRGKYMGI